MDVKIELIPLKPEDKDQFIRDNQESFRFGSMEEFGLRNDYLEEDGEVISYSSINEAIDKGIAYRIMKDDEKVGGIVINVNKNRGELKLLFVSPKTHSKGIGYAAWCEIERMYPYVTLWETETPYFEIRNIHFYVNRCGFHIVEYFNNHHPYPGEPIETFNAHFPNGVFRFVKTLE